MTTQAPLGSSRVVKLSWFDQQSSACGPAWTNEEEKKDAEKTLQRMADAYSTLIECVSDGNPERDGLKKTPLRAAKAMCFFTKGYEEDVASRWTEPEIRFLGLLYYNALGFVVRYRTRCCVRGEPGRDGDCARHRDVFVVRTPLGTILR